MYIRVISGAVSGATYIYIYIYIYIYTFYVYMYVQFQVRRSLFQYSNWITNNIFDFVLKKIKFLEYVFLC